MKKCSFCKSEHPEDNFYMYGSYKMTRGRVQKSFICRQCSDKSYGDKWYPITGYDQKCDISDKGYVRELRGERFYNITYVQNASTRYVYLAKNGKSTKKFVNSLMAKFLRKDEE